MAAAPLPGGGRAAFRWGARRRTGLLLLLPLLAALLALVLAGPWSPACAAGRVCGWVGQSRLRARQLRVGAGTQGRGRVAARGGAAQVSGDWGRSATVDELAQDVPTLYVYDHCPFCVRARMIFGLKSIPYKLAFLLNDDVVTPTRLIGKKVVPVLEAGGKAMGESLDIVAKMDGPEPLLKPAEAREDIKAWLDKTSDLVRKLTRPRVAEAVLPEFATKASRQTWIRNHQFKDGTPFSECMKATPALLQEFNEKLPELDSMLHSDKSVNAAGASYDDITLFPTLRTLTLVKGIAWPDKLSKYIRYMADASDVPLLEKMAC